MQYINFIRSVIQSAVVLTALIFLGLKPSNVLAVPLLEYRLDPESTITFYHILHDETGRATRSEGITESLTGGFTILRTRSPEWSFAKIPYPREELPINYYVAAFNIFDLEFNSPSTQLRTAYGDFDDAAQNYYELDTHTPCLPGKPGSGICLPNHFHGFFNGEYSIGSEQLREVNVSGIGAYTGDHRHPKSIQLVELLLQGWSPNNNAWATINLKATRTSIQVPEINGAGLPLSIGLLLGLVAFFRERVKSPRSSARRRR